jgi:NAD(P)H-dependent FMN reductase
LNQKLLDRAVLGARDASAEVTELSLRELQLPFYDGDLEAESGLPDAVVGLKAQLAAHDALLIATPEYNGGYTAILKNALDWASRPTESDRTGLAPMTGKPAALISASPGALGGIRSQTALQISLHKMGVMVIPSSFALSFAHQAFDEAGLLKDAKADQLVQGVGAALAKIAGKLAA